MKTVHSTLSAGLTALGIMVLVIVASAILAAVAAPGPVAATGCGPNIETELPANGVTSIVKSGENSWIMATDGIPMEVKVLCPSSEHRVVCSYSASLLPSDSAEYRAPCGAVTVFGAAAACVYVQVDGLPGYNSSDPYVCHGNEPTQITIPASPTESPSPSSTPSSPTSTPSATSTPESTPSSTPTVTASAPSPSASASPSPTLAPSSGRELALTGRDLPALMIVVIGLSTVGCVLCFFAGRRS